jgi:hypothetical protein
MEFYHVKIVCKESSSGIDSLVVKEVPLQTNLDNQIVKRVFMFFDLLKLLFSYPVQSLAVSPVVAHH